MRRAHLVVNHPHVMGIWSVPLAPLGFTLDHGIIDPGVGSQGLLFACTGVQISMSPSGFGGGDCVTCCRWPMSIRAQSAL